MDKFSFTLSGALLALATLAAPAFALNNPMVVDLHAVKGAGRDASATIFGSGPSVLVNVTAQGKTPKDAAVTLNAGDCAKPGSIAFALTGLTDNQSLTTLAHPLEEIAGKAKSLVIHESASLTSAPFACGKVVD